MEMTVTFPLDDDGFLRRACPHCLREFKWKPSTGASASTPAATSYYCPYCARPAKPNEWLTKAQVEFVRSHALAAVVEPQLKKLDRAFQDLGRSPNVRVTNNRRPLRAPAPLTEPNDMRIVVAPCHTDEPLKIASGWTGASACLVCGASVPAP